jgi:hypothetical protein
LPLASNSSLSDLINHSLHLADFSV